MGKRASNKSSKQELVGHHPLSPTTLLRGARDFHASLCVLAAGPRPPAAVTDLLAAHCVEIGLKAFLLQIGESEEGLKCVGHNLEKAWRRAQKGGLAVAADPPQWCRTLSSAQDWRFLARYPRVNSGIVAPAMADLVRDIDNLLDEVSREIVSRGGTI